MADPVLLDTGVVVALVNAADPDHDACVAAWTRLRRPVLTVEGVLVEAAHLLREQRGGASPAREACVPRPAGPLTASHRKPAAIRSSPGNASTASGPGSAPVPFPEVLST